MGWSIGYDKRHRRSIGYGVPAVCDHPACNAEIDRGLAFVCGSEPYGGEHGCGLYFCCEHLRHVERDGATVHLCKRCAPEDYKPPYPAKPDRQPDWLRHLLRDPSWARWRRSNPRLVKRYYRALGRSVRPL